MAAYDQYFNAAWDCNTANGAWLDNQVQQYEATMALHPRPANMAQGSEDTNEAPTTPGSKRHPIKDEPECAAGTEDAHKVKKQRNMSEKAELDDTPMAWGGWSEAQADDNERAGDGEVDGRGSTDGAEVVDDDGVGDVTGVDQSRDGDDGVGVATDGGEGKVGAQKDGGDDNGDDDELL